ncbi:hypothetical protein [Sulfoacidibacillus thermotolerans]|uniref:Colicin V production protein n=1 Tax=Sulfoacidibacillus thermotolerans TaxID=1765684 RepID=A0A2U3D6B9_SULT2|nr:hypothetical protein [Sulfoacidibacillus thermotolerans]PWI56820.1 hypothetical protein BM613_11745 [Sulfoacidibacillus thermotolerans]
MTQVIIDLLIVNIVVWTGLMGYLAGAGRVLIYVSVIGGSAYILNSVVPWLHFMNSDITIKMEYLQWLNRMLEPIYPVTWLRMPNVESVYVFSMNRWLPSIREGFRELVAYGTGFAVLIGLLLGVRTFDNLWSDVLGKQRMNSLGALMGGVTGLYIAALTFEVVSSILFGLTDSTPRFWLYHSLLVRTWTHIRLHGIVR